MPENIETIPVSLYHGTSSLFLEGILEDGLCGRDPLTEWRVLEFARAIAPLVKKHCAPRDDLEAKAESFARMVNQQAAALNFPHGQAYVTPSIFKAVQYAANTRYGSELLTYALDFLSELIRMDVEGVTSSLSGRFPQIFEKLDISPAPLLVRVDAVPIQAVLTETGEDPSPRVKWIREVTENADFDPEVLLQQVNFRLIEPAPVADISFIHVTRWDRFAPVYTLFALGTCLDGH